MMFQYSDDELIDGLRQRDSSVIDYLYEKLFPSVRHYLLHNSGNLQDMQDLFHDTLIALYTQSLQEQFKLNSSLKTYFMAVCKNLWLQRLERRYKVLYQAEFEVQEEQADYVHEEQTIEEFALEQDRLFYKNLMKLPGECIRILQLYCLKISYKEIARLLKYKDDVYVKTRKYSCKQLLRKKIINDPECHHLVKRHGK